MMINEIPGQITEIVLKQIKNTPSQYDIVVKDPSLVDGIIKNKKIIWDYKRSDENGSVVYSEFLVEYDSNGIYMYIKSNLISILYLNSLKSNVYFMVDSIYRMNKK
jgi:hypothetical protein